MHNFTLKLHLFLKIGGEMCTPAVIRSADGTKISSFSEAKLGSTEGEANWKPTSPWKTPSCGSQLPGEGGCTALSNVLSPGPGGNLTGGTILRGGPL